MLGVFNEEVLKMKWRKGRRVVREREREGERERERERQTAVRASRSITSENCHPKVVGRCL